MPVAAAAAAGLAAGLAAALAAGLAAGLALAAAAVATAVAAAAAAGRGNLMQRRSGSCRCDKPRISFNPDTQPWPTARPSPRLPAPPTTGPAVGGSPEACPPPPFRTANSHGRPCRRPSTARPRPSDSCGSARPAQTSYGQP